MTAAPRTCTRARSATAVLAMAVALCGGLLAGVHGCATGGVGVDELPDEPIAVLSWTREEARQRRRAGKHPRAVVRGLPIRGVRWSPRGDMLLVVLAEAPSPAPETSATNLYALPLASACALDGGPEDGLDGVPGGGVDEADVSPPGARVPGESATPLRALGRGRDPVFDATGERVVYSAAVGDGWRLRRMRADGSGRAPVGRGVRDEIEPAISPDGRLVAYVAEESGDRRLFVRRMDGSGDRLLLADGAVAHPIW